MPRPYLILNGAAEAFGHLHKRDGKAGARLQQGRACRMRVPRTHGTRASVGDLVDDDGHEARLNRVLGCDHRARASRKSSGDAVARARHPPLYALEKFTRTNDVLPARENFAAQQRTVASKVRDRILCRIEFGARERRKPIPFVFLRGDRFAEFVERLRCCHERPAQGAPRDRAARLLIAGERPQPRRKLAHLICFEDLPLAELLLVDRKQSLRHNAALREHRPQVRRQIFGNPVLVRDAIHDDDHGHLALRGLREGEPRHRIRVPVRGCHENPEVCRAQ